MPTTRVVSRCFSILWRRLRRQRSDVAAFSGAAFKSRIRPHEDALSIHTSKPRRPKHPHLAGLSLPIGELQIVRHAQQQRIRFYPPPMAEGAAQGTIEIVSSYKAESRAKAATGAAQARAVTVGVVAIVEISSRPAADRVPVDAFNTRPRPSVEPAATKVAMPFDPYEIRSSHTRTKNKNKI